VGPHGLRISYRCHTWSKKPKMQRNSSQMRVRMLSVSKASLDFRKRQFHHTRILSRVPKLHFKGSCSPACSLLQKSIWICSEFFVYAREVRQRSFRHGPKMGTFGGQGGEVSQSFVWNRCRETVPPCRVRKEAFCFVKSFFFRVLRSLLRSYKS